MTAANPDTLENIRDGFKGTATYGVSPVITTTTDVEIIAAPAAGFHLEVRRLRCVNKTNAETAVIEIHDDVDTVHGYMIAVDPAANPPDDTGWLDQPIVLPTASALEANALTTTGDTHIQAWADTVAD